MGLLGGEVADDGEELLLGLAARPGRRRRRNHRERVERRTESDAAGASFPKLLEGSVEPIPASR
jgi:hypothetical protein